MTAEAITDAAVWLALAILGIAFLLTVWRVIKGPTLPDRVVALDMLVGIAIGFIALIAIRTGFTLYIDIAISLGLVGFLATVAFARFIMSRPVEGEDIAVVETAILSVPRKKPKQTAARGRIKPSAGSEPGGDTPKPSKKSGRRKGGA